MFGIIFVDNFAESWRTVQAEPVTAFCRCAVTSNGTGCMRRPRARARRSTARRGATIKGRSDDPDGGPGSNIAVVHMPRTGSVKEKS